MGESRTIEGGREDEPSLLEKKANEDKNVNLYAGNKVSLIIQLDINTLRKERKRASHSVNGI